MQRQFTSGSRQAPDPFDQFLEEHQYYRKHTARDASCLFRVISEQMYDTQLHHLAIREKCVTYMRKHRQHFDYHVDRDFDEYLDDMSKPKTYGTLLELQAASYMFERNVFLFEPYNLGNYFSEYRSNFVEVFRVFYTPERHFDSVFTSDYIQEAAICQSICYEILYKDLFKLPDVSFAVEQMLHGPTFENMDYRTENNEEGYPIRLHLSDGRSFELDLPHNTNCILDNYKLCHFHYSNFPRYSDELQRELRSASCEEYDRNSLIIQRTAESFLPNKYMSCVRQLLQEGITPFPYKVAKALDPNMYRNIEFDSWNEIRKELKLQNWYNGDANFKLVRYSTRRVRKIFQVGAKCHVKLRKSEQDLYTCHIQEIAVDKGQCIVFVEQLGEKRLVPYENLTPLPPDQFKPWTVPYRLQRHMQKYSSVRFTRQYNYRFKFNATTEHHHHHEFACGSTIDSDSCSNNYIDDDPKKLARPPPNHHCTTAASYFKLKQYTHLEDFHTHVEYCTMPVTVAHTTREVEVSKTGSNQSRAVDSNENSTTPSRSSTSMGMHRHNMEMDQNKANTNNVEEHVATPQAFVVPQMVDGYEVDQYNANGAFYVPEVQGFYPMYPYTTAPGIPEDYYGYCGFEGVVPTGATLMPPVNNGYVYLCNNTLGAPSNYINSPNPYYLPPPLPQPIGVAQPAPMLATSNATNPSYYAQTNYNSASQSNSGLTTSSSMPTGVGSNTPSRLPPRSVSNTPTKTPVSGRINYDAKKSVKANGNDLPNDVATLRYFYNIGLEYYQKQKTNATEELNNDEDKCTSDFQNMQLDENVKLDVNNNMNSANQNEGFSNESNLTQNQTANKPNNVHSHSSAAGGGGNKNNNNNNQRRYSSRYFGGRDRQMPPHRNNPNQSSQNSAQQQHHQQFHQNYSNQRHFNNHYNNNNNNTKYSNNNYTARNTQQQNLQQNHLQPLPQVNTQHLPQSAAADANKQISPNCALEDPLVRSSSAEPRNRQTPTTMNNCNTGMASADQINDGISIGSGNSGQFMAPLQTNNPSGVYIPMPITAGPPPPPPYGIFGTHPVASGPHQPAPGVAMHPNFMTAPPPQIITHCGPLPPPPPPPPFKQQNSLNAGPGLELVEGVCNSEMAPPNGGLMPMPPPGVPIQCPNYPPPPPMPIYYSTNSVNSLAGGANGMNGTLSAASASGVHLVTPFSHQMTPSTPSNQTAFASPHPTLGSQGFYCLQPPPLLSSQQQPVTPQLIPQSAQMPNKLTLSNTLPPDNNNNNTVPRNDLVQQNNE